MQRRWIIAPIIFIGLMVYSAVLAQGNIDTYAPLVYNAPIALTPTPTYQSGGVELLPNHTAFPYYHSDDTWYFVGEIQNNTNQVISEVGLTIEFINNGEIVRTDTRPERVKLLPPGEKTCFQVGIGRTNDPLPEFDEYRIDPNVQYIVISAPVEPVMFGGVTTEIVDPNHYAINGVWFNDKPYAVSPGITRGTIYSDDGKVAGCSYRDFWLDSGDGAEFTLDYTIRSHYLDITEHRITAYAVPLNAPFTPTPTRTFTPTRTPTPTESPPTPTHTTTPTPINGMPLLNGNFENGDSGEWDVNTNYNDIPAIVDPSDYPVIPFAPRQGSYMGLLLKSDNEATSLSQVVTIEEWQSEMLVFYQFETAESFCGKSNDIFRISINGDEVYSEVLCQPYETNGWNILRFDLRGYRGETISLTVSALSDNGDITYLALDDLTIH